MADETVTTNTPDTWATISYVPQNAQVQLTVDGISGHTVELQAMWLQTGDWEPQKQWTADPDVAEHFEATRICSLRIGIPTGGAGTGDVTLRVGYDYPVRRA